MGERCCGGTPGGRHGISAIEAADRASDHEPTIHWKVSRTSAACREGFPKTPLAQRYAERARGADWRYRSNLASPPITCPLINSEQKRKKRNVFPFATALNLGFALYLSV